MYEYFSCLEIMDERLVTAIVIGKSRFKGFTASSKEGDFIDFKHKTGIQTNI